jgi:hypothetical protein
MTDSDIWFNVGRLRKEGTAKLSHADALEAFGRDKTAAGAQAAVAETVFSAAPASPIARRFEAARGLRRTSPCGGGILQGCPPDSALGFVGLPGRVGIGHGGVACGARA